MIWALTYFFQVSNYGWSETYYVSASTPAAAELSWQTIATARLAMAPPDCFMSNGRISDVNVKGDSYPLTSTFPLTGAYAHSGGLTSALGQNCLRTLFNAGPLKRANRFLHGIPANQYTATAYLPTADFTPLLDSFLTAVQSGCGCITRIPGAVASPFWSYTAYTGYDVYGGDFRKVGRPFGQPVGRRLIA